MNGNGIKNTSDKSWTRAAAMIFCIIASLAAAYIIFKYLFGLLLPFLIGAGVAALASAVSAKLSRYTRASVKTVSFAVLILLLALMLGMLFLAGRRLITELGNLAQSLATGEGAISDFIYEAVSLFESLGEKIGRLLPSTGNSDPSETVDTVNSFLEKILRDILSALGSAIPGILSTILKALPAILLGTVVSVITAFYFTLDSKRIKSGIRSLLPSPALVMISHIKKEAAIAAVGYLRSYSLILLITFAEIFFGLSVLGVEYSFLIAAVSALVDILPVLGVGIVLIPWALFCLITRDLFLGIGLIILYVIIVIVRQFIEPKIVGENLGLHPLLTLAAFYLGYSLFGFAGIILAPILLILWRAVKAYSGSESITRT